MTTGRIESLAADFWDRAGPEEPFPRQLERAIALTCPITIVRLPRLSPPTIKEWLRRRGQDPPIATRDRRLDGCLVVHRGAGFLFLDGGLDPSEARATIAHELAHFLAEYDSPRGRIERRLGRSLLAVCDHDRAAAPEERLGAALAGVGLGVHVHYLDRPDGGELLGATRTVEETADELGRELLAPWRVVLGRAQAEGISPTDPTRLRSLLEAEFGLPSRWAIPYARRLGELAESRASFSRRLGL